MKTIYIAGKVSGEPLAECTMKFGMAQKKIEALGFNVVNPLALIEDCNTPWDVAMKKCIGALVNCDAVVLLPCWQNSNGAKIEHQLADDLNIPVFNFHDKGLQVMVKNLQ